MKITMALHKMKSAMISNSSSWNTVEENQYSLTKIIGIWAAAVLPMFTLGWIVFPAVSPDFKTDPLGAGVTRFVLLTGGLIWLFVLSMIIDGILLFALPSRVFHSTWMAIILHSLQSLFFLFLLLGIILGLA